MNKVYPFTPRRWPVVKDGQVVAVGGLACAVFPKH